MKALTIVPGKANSASVENVPEPPSSDGDLLVRARQLGICGTDFELIAGNYGWAPPGSERLILGHESLGTVEEAPAGSGFAKGDLVVGIVRRPDPEPCLACAALEWDMCRSGKYTERGIKERNGFGSEFWRTESSFAIKLDARLRDTGILLEPASVLAKAWEHIAYIGARAKWAPRACLVTGAGPIGLLGAMMARQRGLDVHVLDQVPDGPKPQLVKELGATYHTGPLRKLGFAPDVIVECTGAAAVIAESTQVLGSDGILCLVGVSAHPQAATVNAGELNEKLMMTNSVIFGSVNANRRHYELAGEALLAADQPWLAKLITRKEPLGNWREALNRHADDIKVVIELGG